MIVTLSSIAVPGTNGFAGEFLILLGAYESSLRWYTIIATSGVILAAVYMLWMFQRVMFGELENPKNQNLKDLNVREIAIMVPLVVLIFVIGVYPNPFIEKMTPSIKKVIAQAKVQQTAAQAVSEAQPVAAPAEAPQAATQPAAH